MANTITESVTVAQLEQELADAINSVGGDVTGLPVTDMPEYIENNLIAESWDILGGEGILVESDGSNYTIKSTSDGLLSSNIDALPDSITIQDALVALTQKLSNTSGIQSGSVIRTNADGLDEEYPDVTDLLENSFYIRLILSNGSVLHISAYEIDKALSIIAQMSDNKASQSDVDALTIALDSKASAAQVTLLESDLAGKADKTTVADLSASVETKADKTTVDNLSASVETKADKTTVDNLSASVETKADKTTVAEMQADVEALEAALNSLSDNNTIAAITAQINYLNDEINRRLTIDDLSNITNSDAEINNKIADNTRRIGKIEDTLTSKASIAYVQRNTSELNNAITSLASRFSSKADKVELAAKASQDDLNVLVKRIAALNTSTSEGITELEECCKLVKDELTKKASKTSLENLTADINAALDVKADKLDVADSVNLLTNTITNVKENFNESLGNLSSDMHDVEVGLNNTMSILQSTINVHDRKLLEQGDQLERMQEFNYRLEEATRNEWVRVMTPEEYNRLSNVPNYDGDPYAKKPNVLYMLVRFNKPIAIYIGTILIAQARQDGSVGFAYDFPIIF